MKFRLYLQKRKYYTQHISYDELITTEYSTGESDIRKVNLKGEGMFGGGLSACLEAGAGAFLAEREIAFLVGALGFFLGIASVVSCELVSLGRFCWTPSLVLSASFSLFN